MNTKELTKLRDEKQAINRELEAKLVTLKIRHGDLLLQKAEGQEVDKEITAIEKQIEGVTRDLEKVCSLLTAIPKQLALAQADEIEDQIRMIEGMKQRLPALAEEIDRAAETFAQAAAEYFKIVEDLRKANGYSLYFRGVDIGAKNSLSFYLHERGIYPQLSIGDFRGALPMAKGKSLVHNGIETILFRMRAHAEALRGASKDELDFCKNCYGGLSLDLASGKKICSLCGTVEGEL